MKVTLQIQVNDSIALRQKLGDIYVPPWRNNHRTNNFIVHCRFDT